MKQCLINCVATKWKFIFLFCIALGTASFLSVSAQQANLMMTYVEGNGTATQGNFSAGDSVTINVWAETDLDTPAGTHTICYSGGITRTQVNVTVGTGAGAITPGQRKLVDSFTQGSYDPGPATPAPDSFPATDCPPAHYAVGQSPPTTVVLSGTALLDYNPTTLTAVDGANITVNSNWEWNHNLSPSDGHADATLGYEDAYFSPARNAQSTTLNITLHIWGPIKQAKHQPFHTCPCQTCHAMAVASLDRFQAGISISDAPIGYTPPIGPSMYFQVTYHQRLDNQPSTFNFSNLGPLWSFNWLSYIGDGPTNKEYQATYYAPGGSQYTFGGYQENLSLPGGPYQGDFTNNEGWTLSTLHYRQNPERYERWLPDGTVEVFGLGVGAAPNRLFFLTSITDPQGNVTKLAYDPNGVKNGQAILVSVTDPLGQQLIFNYDNSDPLKITKVTRSLDQLSAKFQYTNGELTSSTDPLGITSSFAYATGSTFVNAMTTPYGTTTFSSTDGSGYLEADSTNPLGQTERVEYQETVASSAISDNSSSAPSAPGLTVDASNLTQANSFYWSRREYADALAAGSVDSAAFYAKAEISHWAQGEFGSVPVPLSAKKPLEGRVWYNYPGQPDPDYDHVNVTAPGVMVQPSVTARVQDNGTTQASFASYNSNGLITQSIDPLGRKTNYSYFHYGLTNAVDDNDLNQVTQTNTGSSMGYDVLSTSSSYYLHEPQQTIDASGQVTSLTYNGQGQLLTRTVTVSGAAQTTTLTYTGPSGSGTGNYMTEVTSPPVSGTSATTNYTYDTAGRVSTVKDSEGYIVTTAYDNLDRPISTTYPDGTSDQTVYHILDVDHTIDRQSRVTYNSYDAIRELLQTTDPQGRITKYSWCTCGGLSTLTDANGNVTTWGLDTQGRVTSKTYAGHTSPDITYAYETNLSRLHSMTDANGNVATYSYNSDNTLASTSYTPGTGIAATPNVSFTYDTPYNRVLTMTDGSGTTHYAYNPITGTATLGAGRLATVTSPVQGTGSTAAVAYTYDELGRVINRTINSANPVGTTFDALGRVTNVTNALGAFGYSYIDQTSRLHTVTDPVGTGGTGLSLNTTYSYYGNTGDQRLQEIKNLKGTTPLSDFQYTYNPVGTIATWTQQADSSTAVVNTLTYDNADQLTNAVQSGGGSASNAYHYDPAGNRLAEITGSGTTAGQFNNLNQLTGLTSSPTSQIVAGHTSAAITSATINATPASITSSTNFTATVAMPSGTNVVSVVAQPSSGSITTQRYQVVASGAAPTALSYDLNGNLLTDENGNVYTWDALNRLKSIVYHSGANSGNHSEFAYDGLSRRIQILERTGTTVGGGTTTSTRNYLWIGQEIAEERDHSNTVTKRFFAQGEQQSGTPYYYTRDHLGSIRELLNSSGTIVSRLSYDAYGNTTVVSGTTLPTFGFDGMYWHQPSGFYLTRAGDGRSTGRPYDTLTARFPSRDPIAEAGGINLYKYVGNDPIEGTDPMGEQAVPIPRSPAQAAAYAAVITAAIIYCELNPKCAAALHKLENAAAQAALHALQQAQAKSKTKTDCQNNQPRFTTCHLVYEEVEPGPYGDVWTCYYECDNGQDQVRTHLGGPCEEAFPLLLP